MNEKTPNTTIAANKLPIGTEVVAVEENDHFGLTYIGTLIEYTGDGTPVVRCPVAGTMRAARIEPLHHPASD